MSRQFASEVATLRVDQGELRQDTLSQDRVRGVDGGGMKFARC
jgi:hypothetical protein